MDVADFQTGALQVFGKILGGLLGESGHQHPLAAFDALAAELDGLVDLVLERPQDQRGIEQAGRTDDLLDHQRLAGLRGIEVADRLRAAARDDLELLQVDVGEAAVVAAALHRDESLVVRPRVDDLEGPRRRRDVEPLVRHVHELVEAQRPVVEGARQAETVIHEHRLAALVALIHPADLRDRRVTLVHHEEVALGEEVEQRVRPRSRRAAC